MQGIRLHSNRPWWNPSEVKDKNSGRLGQAIYKSWLKKLLILILGQPPRTIVDWVDKVWGSELALLH